MLKHVVKSLFNSFAESLVAFSRTFGRQVWFVFLAVFSMGIMISKPPITYAQATFSDVQGHWAQPCIEQLTQKQMISGYPDGSFKPSANVTRAEFAAMIRKAFPNAGEVRTGGQFADVPANYWAADAIRQAYKTGFLSGYPGQLFQPTQKIPRSQVLVSLANGLKYSPTRPVADVLNTAFADATGIPSYGRDAIAAATERQLVVNYPNVRSLKPNQLATRAEVAAFLCQATGSIGLVPSQYVATVGTTPKPTAELRGVWLTNIDSDVLFDRNRLANAIEKLDQLNFNTLYPAVWNWGYTLYPSTVAQKVTGRSLDPEPGLQGRDMLKEVVDQGHQRKMGVIPWFEFGFMAPADSELAKRHPEWLLKKLNGGLTWDEGTHKRVWLNPFRPEVQQFIEDLVVEIVTKYDVDGIQFDDHFGFPAEFGYDDFTVALYKQENQGKSPPTDPQNPQWVRWRANKITEYLKRLFQVIKDKKPNVIVSLSPNPQEFSYKSFLADWQTWEQQGLIEELIIQVYRDDLSRFIAELERPEVKAAQRHIPVAIGVLTGIKPRPIPISQIQQQVQTVRNRGLAGVSFFFYESLWNLAKEPSAERQSAIKAVFPAPIKRPNILAGWQPSS